MGFRKWSQAYGGRTQKKPFGSEGKDGQQWLRQTKQEAKEDNWQSGQFWGTYDGRFGILAGLGWTVQENGPKNHKVLVRPVLSMIIDTCAVFFVILSKIKIPFGIYAFSKSLKKINQWFYKS